jgi:hypothetical protein
MNDNSIQSQLLSDQHAQILALEESIQLLGRISVAYPSSLGTVSKIHLRLLWLLTQYPSNSFSLKEYQSRVMRLREILNPESPCSPSLPPGLSLMQPPPPL